ncbi:endoglucanase [Inmirania thermothiophila]|uniref:Endoglucanase n=1 Tax=Inmirania thermothiophila TaxID=1750597 RepID=A0A3N1Y1L5_9GAMM|nr:endoglucanase [Inmirania thermothiophila]
MIGRPPPGLRAGEWARLAALLACPTAPTREEAVAAWAAGWLEAAGVPWCRDAVGNLLVGEASPAAWRARVRVHGVVACAHMDHPGLVGRRWRRDGTLEARWLGGGPLGRLAGARVWLAAGGRILARGVVREAGRPGRGGTPLRVVPDEPLERPAAALSGGLDFEPAAWRRGARLYARAFDDLAGVFAVVCAAVRRRRAPPPGLLTRAEEVGFVGLVGHLERHGPLEDAVLVSLEASAAGPGARPGGGPVVRLGDRSMVFDPGGCEALARLARRVLGAGGFQRRLMDGGTCEATAAQAWGGAAAGLAVPLVRYHNQGADGAPAPESVHVADLAGLVRLVAALGRAGLDVAGARARLRRRIGRRAAPLLAAL